MGNWPMNSPLALKVLKCKLPALFSTGNKAPQQTLQGPLSADIRKPTVCRKCMKDMGVLLQAHGPFSVERLYSFYYMPKGFARNQLCGILEEASALQQFREEMNHMGATYPGQVCFTQEGSCHSQRSLRNMGGGESFSIWGILGVRKQKACNGGDWPRFLQSVKTKGVSLVMLVSVQTTCMVLTWEVSIFKGWQFWIYK